MLNSEGPVPRSKGTRDAVAEGSRSKVPYAVFMTSVLLVVANEGRSLNSVSPFRSWPTVMLKGVPELVTSIGLNEMPKGACTLPPSRKRLRTSKVARP